MTDQPGCCRRVLQATTGKSTAKRYKQPRSQPMTLPGNVVEVKFTRGKTDGIEIELKVDNDADWSNGGRFPKSPAVLNIAVNGGLPRAVHIRARFLDGNTPFGQHSDTVYVATTT